MSLSEVLTGAAKRNRKPVSPEAETPETEGGEVAPKPKRERKPKMVQAMNEDGTPQVDADGNPVMIEAPKKERTPKLDADGNPIPRKSNVFLGTQVLKLTDKGINTTYREDSKRGTIFRSIKDGMTVDEFYALNGGKSVSHTFLVWYVNEAEVVTVE